MDDKLSPEDRRRIQKGALLKKFADVKKNNFTAARLCVAMGMVGAHRFYLGQRLFGGLIAAVFGVLLILVLLFKDNPDYVNMVMIWCRYSGGYKNLRCFWGLLFQRYYRHNGAKYAGRSKSRGSVA